MPLATLSYFSRSIGLSSTMTVLLPDAPSRFPVYYLLHGLSDDHSTWTRRTALERYVAGLPLIVVMPETGRGWYTNAASPPGLRYEDHLINDVIPLVDRTFPTIAARESRAIGGLSMGGYGAVKLALKFPHLFCAANSHSGPLMTPLHKPEARPKSLQPQQPEFEAIFGPGWCGGENDPVALSAKCPRLQRPALQIDCGVGDFLLDQNREFHAHLAALDFPHEYHEFDGEHNWAYWDLHIRDALRFHCSVLKIPV